MAGQGPIDQTPSAITDEDFSSGGTAVRIASVAALGGLLFGYDSAVINGAVDSIQARFGIGNAELGFAVASALLGAAAGAMSAGRIADRIGRISVMKIAAVFFFISAIGTGLAPNVATVVIFRIVGGIGVGIASVIAPAYIAETSPPRIRGRLGSLQQLAIVSGIFLSLRHQLAAAARRRRPRQGPVAGAGGVAVDVPRDGHPRGPVRQSGVHDSGVAALSRCQPQDPGSPPGADHAAGREEPGNHHQPDPGDPGARGQAVVAGSAQADGRSLRHRLGRSGAVDLPAVRRYQRDLLLLQRALAGGRVRRRPVGGLHGDHVGGQCRDNSDRDRADRQDRP